MPAPGDRTGPLYLVTDLAWPLSMVLTFVVGVVAVFARRLPGWKRFAPLYCGVTLPLMLVLTVFGATLPMYLFGVHTVTGWVLLGYVAFSTRPTYVAPTPTSAAVPTTA